MSRRALLVARAVRFVVASNTLRFVKYQAEREAKAKADAEAKRRVWKLSPLASKFSLVAQLRGWMSMPSLWRC